MVFKKYLFGIFLLLFSFLITTNAFALDLIPTAPNMAPPAPEQPVTVCLPIKNLATFAEYDHCKRSPANGQCLLDDKCAEVRCLMIGRNKDQKKCDALLPNCSELPADCQLRMTPGTRSLLPSGEPPASSIKVDNLKEQAKSALNQTTITGPEQYLGQVIKFFIGAMGGLLLIRFIYAGFTWMTAFGNSEKIEQAKKIMVWSTLGVVVILASYIIIGVVFKFL